MATSPLEPLKSLIPNLDKAIEIEFVLLLTSFMLLTDCAALYVHDTNILHLLEVPEIIKPNLAVEAIILVIGFGMVVIAMRFFWEIAYKVTKNTFNILSRNFKRWHDSSGQELRADSFYSVSVDELRDKAHASKESYYLNLLKEAKAEKDEHLRKTRQIALFAFTVLVLSGVDLFAPLSPNGTGILAQIADGLGQNGYSWLFCLGGIPMALAAFFPVFENPHKMIYCPGLAEEKRQQEREQQERSRQEAEKLKASPPLPPPPIHLSTRRDSFTPQKPND